MGEVITNLGTAFRAHFILRQFFDEKIYENLNKNGRGGSLPSKTDTSSNLMRRIIHDNDLHLR